MPLARNRTCIVFGKYHRPPAHQILNHSVYVWPLHAGNLSDDGNRYIPCHIINEQTWRWIWIHNYAIRLARYSEAPPFKYNNDKPDWSDLIIPGYNHKHWWRVSMFNLIERSYQYTVCMLIQINMSKLERKCKTYKIAGIAQTFKCVFELSTQPLCTQAPVPLTIFRSNSKFDQNWERSSFKYT